MKDLNQRFSERRGVLRQELARLEFNVKKLDSLETISGVPR